MKYFLFTASFFVLAACNEPSTFINHSLSSEKVGDCSMKLSPPNMNSNTNGERYVFDYCVEDGFDNKNYKVDRKGDTVVVSFTGIAAAKKALYKMTLDIDAKPRYHYIVLGDQTLEISPSAY